MKKVTLYIAASMDGFIARRDGSIDWLPQPVEGGEDYGYGGFLATVDTLLMGRKTYEQVLTFGPWPYEGKRCVVFSGSRSERDETRVEWVDCDVAAFVRELKVCTGEGVIWLVGGAEIIAACLGGDVVDEIIQTTVPVLIGDGVRLFPETNWTTPWRLGEVKAYADGLVQMTYARGEVAAPALAFG